MKNPFIISCITGLALFACSPSNPKTGLFFAGQIINPSSRQITLYQGDQTVDIVALDENLRFEKQYDSMVSGIYKLEHLPEYQTLLLETGDSLWVRINAAAFDESIVFSGLGASKNNFLMELFLKQEEETRFLSSKYSSSSKTFNRILDSLVKDKKNIWIIMDSLNTLSPIAQKVTQAAYIYPYASIRERYALLRGLQWNSYEDSVYFGYRKYLSFEDTDLAYFDPYVNYILNFISVEAQDRSLPYFQQKSTTNFNIRRLEVLDRNIKGSLLRNNLARAIALEEILTFENHSQHERFLQFYSTVNTSPNYLAEVLDLHTDISLMEPKKTLPEIELENTHREIVSSMLLANGNPTVIYFWSQTQMNHYRDTLERVKQMEDQYPSIRFVGICIQPFNNMVEQVHEMLEVRKTDQFALVDFEKAGKAWVLTLLNKAIVLDQKGKIVEGFGNFLDNDFELILKGLN
ncbi:MAG: hypothetical protein VW262_03025 [Flavobacteriaceae bacterium]